jgi:hypothetical protein
VFFCTPTYFDTSRTSEDGSLAVFAMPLYQVQLEKMIDESGYVYECRGRAAACALDAVREKAARGCLLSAFMRG